MQEIRQEKSPIKQNILLYLSYIGMSQYDFYKKTGITRGVLGQKNGISEENLSRFIDYFPCVSLEWLIRGRGNMLNEVPDQQIQVTNLQPAAATVPQQSIPVYDLQINANVHLGDQFDAGLTPSSYISLPNMPKCDGAIILYGDSMAPTLESGDVVVYKRVKDIRKGLFLGHMYLVTFEMDGEEYLMVRYVRESEDKDCLKLASNKASMDISLDSIKGMAMIKASVRRYEP